MNCNNQFFKIVLLVSLFVLFTSPHLFSEENIQFKSDYAIFVIDPQRPDIYITLFIPYNQLNFVIVDTLFKAEVYISAILYSGGKQKGGDIWRRKVLLKDIEQTYSNKKGVVWTFNLGFYPGTFDLHIKVKDIYSAREGKKIEKIEVADVKKEPLWVSQPAFFQRKEGEKKEWLISGDLNVELDSVYSLVEVVSDTASNDSFLIRYKAIGEKGDSVLKINKYIEMDSVIKNEFFMFSIKEFKEGDYSILVEVIKEGKTIAHSKKTITIAFPFFLSKSYYIRVEQMSYITSNKEMKKLKESQPEEREKVWNEFWSKKDPIPETPENETSEEYFKRVDYANEYFSTFQSGWRTDRGRIYIIYGEPDEIEYHPFDLESPPYQIWYYYNLGKRFIFADFSMTGDYNLIRER